MVHRLNFRPARSPCWPNAQYAVVPARPVSIPYPPPSRAHPPPLPGLRRGPPRAPSPAARRSLAHPPWLPAAMARFIPYLHPSRAHIPSSFPIGLRLGHQRLHRRRSGAPSPAAMAAYRHGRVHPRMQVLQPPPRKASTAIEKSFNHRHRKLQWHFITRGSCNRSWILLLPAKLFATSTRRSCDLATTTTMIFAATVVDFCYYR